MTLAPAFCLFLGLLLLRSATAKLKNPKLFLSILQSYPGGVRFRSPESARLIPAVELLIGLAMVLPFSVSKSVATLGSMVFIALASIEIFRRYLRGESRFACGCSHNLEREGQVKPLLVRNATLILLTVCILLSAPIATSPFDYPMGLALLLAFELLETAGLQEGRVQAWKARG